MSPLIRQNLREGNCRIERRCGEVVTRPPTIQEIPGSIPGRSGRLSEFRCDLINRSDNTWNPVRKLQETMWAALGKPLMSNYPLRKAMVATTVRLVRWFAIWFGLVWFVWLCGRMDRGVGFDE